MPDGAMYMMIGINIEHFPEFQDELQFVKALVKVSINLSRVMNHDRTFLAIF